MPTCARRPRPAPARGFTLVEILIVVVVLGILAAIAIPRFTGSRSRATQAGAKSDLRNLMTSQTMHREDNPSYAGSLDTLGLKASDGVSLTILESSATGWSARATSQGSTCSVYVGTAAAVPPATTPTVIACE